MWVEIIERKMVKGKRLIRLDGDIVPAKLRSADGITYSIITKPEYGDMFEIKPDGDKWGIYKDSLEVVE